MNANNHDLIPICLVTGFLGCGKTTFLKHIVEKHRSQKLVYIINEFSPHDIDGAIVSKENPDVVSIPGGSIFCKCLVTEFIGRLTSIPSSFDGVEGVVIEASGMANPKVIADMLRETKLDSRYTLANVISIVDPGSFLKLRKILPNISAQIEASDNVIINKTDLHTAETITETEDAVKDINPQTTAFKTVNADIDIDLFKDTAARELHGDYAKCKDPSYESATLKITHNIDINELQRKLLAVENDLYRVKGYLPTAAGTVSVEYTKSGFTTSPADTGENTIVIIMRGNPQADTGKFITWLSAQT
jgi:G3E family GTPase